MADDANEKDGTPVMVKWFWFLAGLIVAFGLVNLALEILILTR